MLVNFLRYCFKFSRVVGVRKACDAQSWPSGRPNV